jgi:hypothetical protein
VSGGLGWESLDGRESKTLGAEWGIQRGSLLQRIFNAVIPVSIVSRYRGEKEGSLFGLTASHPGNWGLRPAVEFFSLETDWLLHGINVSFPIMNNVGSTGRGNSYWLGVHLFSPQVNVIPYNVIGPWRPQLVTNTVGSQGSVVAESGCSGVNNPNGPGLMLFSGVLMVGVGGSHLGQDADAINSYWLQPVTDKIFPYGHNKKLMPMIRFDPPFRIRRHRVIDVQIVGEDDTFFYEPYHSISVGILYSELPNPREQYFT